MMLSERLQQLQADNTSGAMTLLERALDLLEAFAAQPVFQGHEAFHPALEALLQALLAAQPSMAPMLNLAHQALQACPLALSPPTAQQRLRDLLHTLRQHVQHSLTDLCQQALDVIPLQATVLTYSNSGTVVAALQHAHRHGRLRRVILSESRPTFDGRPQALALLQQGIDVQYSIDMALFERLPEAQVVLVGADAVFPHGVVNKLGTQALAHLARLHHVPLLSLCTSSKFLPAAAAPLLYTAEHPTDEVWPNAPSGLDIRNRYFDTTPLALFSGIVSETRLYTPAALRRHLQRQELSAALQRLASQEHRQQP